MAILLENVGRGWGDGHHQRENWLAYISFSMTFQIDNFIEIIVQSHSDVRNSIEKLYILYPVVTFCKTVIISSINIDSDTMYPSYSGFPVLLIFTSTCDLKFLYHFCHVCRFMRSPLQSRYWTVLKPLGSLMSPFYSHDCLPSSPLPILFLTPDNH